MLSRWSLKYKPKGTAHHNRCFLWKNHGRRQGRWSASSRSRCPERFLCAFKIVSRAVQTVVLHDCELEDKNKCPSQSALHRTQVAVFNRASAKGQLKFKIKLEVKDEVSKRKCATDGVESTLLDTTFCSGHGVCQDTPTLAHGYECKCLPSWTGTSCSSPDKDAFSMAELQHAASQVTRLCNTCDDDTATLSQGAIVCTAHRAQADKGLELSIFQKRIGDPDVFVADELPRSLFDLRTLQLLDLRKLHLQKTESGVYWVAIRSSAGDVSVASIPSGPRCRRLDSTGGEQYKCALTSLEIRSSGATTTPRQPRVGYAHCLLRIMLCLCGGCIFRCASTKILTTPCDKLNKQGKGCTTRRGGWLMLLAMFRTLFAHRKIAAPCTSAPQLGAADCWRRDQLTCA